MKSFVLGWLGLPVIPISPSILISCVPWDLNSSVVWRQIHSVVQPGVTGCRGNPHQIFSSLPRQNVEKLCSEGCVSLMRAEIRDEKYNSWPQKSTYRFPITHLYQFLTSRVCGLLNQGHIFSCYAVSQTPPCPHTVHQLSNNAGPEPHIRNLVLTFLCFHRWLWKKSQALRLLTLTNGSIWFHLTSLWLSSCGSSGKGSSFLLKRQYSCLWIRQSHSPGESCLLLLAICLIAYRTQNFGGLKTLRGPDEKSDFCAPCHQEFKKNKKGLQ